VGALAIDLKFAVRMLRRSPGVTAAAIVALALGIGANTAIFSVVDGVLLRPLPYSDSARLVLVNGAYPSMGRPRTAMSYLEYQDVRAQSRALADVAAYEHGDFNLSGTSGAPERVTVGFASATLFPTLGVQPFLGRSFSAEEEHAGSDEVAIIDYATWRDRFGGDVNAVGRTLVLDNVPYRIIGVLPRGFRFAGTCSAWIPLSTSEPSTRERGSHWLKVVGRMRAGVSRAQLDSDLAAVSQRISEIDPAIYGNGWHVFAEPLLERIVGDSRPALLVLLGAVAFVLLIACANVANLMLARAAARRREMAVRTALGAKPSRLVRQLLTESLLLSLLGGALGVLLAVWGIDALLALAPEALPRAGEVALDGRVLLYSFGLAVATGVAFGLAPAIAATRLNLDDGLRDGARGASSSRGRLKRALVIGELALSLMLLVGTGLMVRSFLALRAVDPGLDPAHVLTMRTGLPSPKGAPTADDRARWVAWFARATARLSQLPGVRVAAASDILPFENSESRYTFELEGAPPRRAVDLPHEEVREVTPGYFEALGMSLVRGRVFADGDRDGAPSVVVINQALARRYWPHGEDPVGKRLKLHHDPKRDWSTIVGVVGDVRDYGLDQPVRPELYVPYSQLPEYSGMAMIVRTDGDAAALTGAARAALGEVDASQPIYDVQPMSELVRASLAQRRFALILMLVFAVVALLLAAVGIYGVMSYSVAQRTQEIGIRVALGASSTSVLGLVVGDGMRLVGAGLVLGIAGALALTRLVSSLLYAVSTTDAVTFSLVALLLVVVALVATIIPARRAMRVDPMQALRSE
jgi:putative ABC transport system permease protein